MRMRIFISAAVVVVLASAAHAEPKTVTLDNCTKVEMEPRADVRPTGTVTSITVKCTGEARDPEVRKPDFGISNGWIINGVGTR